MASIDIGCIRIRIWLKIIQPRVNGKSNLIRGGRYTYRYNNITFKKKVWACFKANPTDNDTINKNLNNTGIFYSPVYFENIFFESVYSYFISCALTVINIKPFISSTDLVECIIDKSWIIYPLINNALCTYNGFQSNIVKFHVKACGFPLFVFECVGEQHLIN